MFNARDRVEFRNTITTGQVTSYVSDGNFQLIAGAVINADLGVFMGQQGSGAIGFGGIGGDILIDGTVNAGSVTLQTNSRSQATNIVTGASGLLSGGGSLSLLNAGIDGGRIDVATKNFSVTNVNVGTVINGNPGVNNPDIGISIDQQAGNLRVAAVPSSRGQISLKASAPGAKISIDSDIKTQAGLSLDASDLIVSSPLTTEAGNIQLAGDTVTLGGYVTAGKSGVGNVQVTSRKGAVSVLSAAVVSASGQLISISSATNITSQARLVADSIAVAAKGAISLSSNANSIAATAGTGISVTASNDLVVTSATTDAGNVSVTAGGILTVDAVTIKGQGSTTLAGSAGLLIDDLRLKNGSGTVSSDRGSVRVTGTVAIEGTNNDLSLTSSAGNVIVDASADVSVADQLSLAAPKGRVLTPGSVTAVTVDSSGAGYTSPPTVTLDAGNGATASPMVFADGIAGIRVTNGGSGYVTAPKVNIIGGGVNAQATAFLSGGSVARIVISNPGSGYSSTNPPVITFSGGSGSGATAEAMVGGVSSISVTNAGSGYLIPPEVVISAGAGAEVSPITINASGGIKSINLSSRGSDYGVAPTVQITDSSGSGYGATATASLTSGVSSYLLTNQGSGYATPPAISFTNAVGDKTGSGAEATALIAGGITSKIALNNGGTGYSPNVQVSIVGDGRGATATATIDGSVTTLTLGPTGSSGTGYATVPDVTFSASPTGDTATATALLGLTSSSVGLTYTPQFTGQQPTLYYTAPSISFKAPAGGRAARGTILLDPTGLASGIQIDDPGAGYTTFSNSDFTVSNAGALVKFGGSTLGGQASALSFTVSTLNLTNAGSGYTFDPTVFFSGGGNASATAAVTGEIASVTVGALGTGYTTAPSVVFSGGNGTNASASTTLDAKVVGIQILSAGTGYTAAPSVSFANGSAAATVFLSSVVSGITVGAEGTGYNPATTTVTLIPVAGGGGAISGAVTTNDAGTITGINLATSGDDYVTAPQVTINDTSGLGQGATATATVVNKKVTGFTIINGGTGYNPSTTVVTIASAGSGAAAVANLDASGNVASVTVTNSGSGYQSGAGAPNVRIVPYGQTATGTATIAPGQVTGVRVDTAGSGYTSAPTVTISGGGGNGATASATVVGGVLTAITVVTAGSGYTGQVIVSVTGGGGSGATATALVGGVSTPTVEIDNNASYFNYATLPKVTFSGGKGSPQATGTAIISKVAQINANRLSWTALESPLEAVTSQFRKLNVNLTGKGDLVLKSTSGALELQGATTTDGSITVSAPSLKVTGDVVVGDASSTRTKQIELTASAGDLTIDSPVGTLLAGALQRTPLAQKITLTALQGGITATGTPGLLTTNDVVFTSTNSATLQTSTNKVTGSVSNSTGTISITQNTPETNGTILPLVAPLLSTTGGSVTMNVGSKLSVGRIDTGIAGTGTISLTATELVEDTADAASDLVAGTVQLLAQTGNIKLDTTASLIGASAALGQITITNVSSDGTLAVPPLKLQTVTARNSITVSSASTITASDLRSTASNPITLTATGATSNLLVDGISSVGGVVSLTAGGNVGRINPSAITTSITTGAARVSAGGTIDLRTNVASLAATAVGNIDIVEGDDISLGEPTGLPAYQFVKSTTGDVTVTAGGSISAFNVQSLSNNATPRTGIVSLTTGATGSAGLGTVVAGTLKVTTKGDVSDKDLGSGIIDVDTLTITAAGGLIDLTSQNNRVGTFSATNAGGDVRLKDTDSGLVIAGITGKAVRLTAVGAVSQTGAIVATDLVANGAGGSIDLSTQSNTVNSFGSTNGSGSIAFKDTAGGLTLTGITGGTVTITAAGAVDQSGGAVTAGAFTVNGNGSAIDLSTQSNAVTSFAAKNGGGSVLFNDTAGGLALAGITGGTVTIGAAGAVTQSAAVSAGAFTINGNGSAIDLSTQSNTVTSFAAKNGSGSVLFNDTAGGLTLASITGGTVTITAAGAVDQSGGAVTAGAFTVNGNGSAINLSTQNNAVTSFGSTNGSGSIVFKDTAGTLTLAGITGGAVTITAAGAIDQNKSSAVNAGAFTVNGNGSAITLLEANDVAQLSVVNSGGAFSFRDVDDLQIVSLQTGNTGSAVLNVGGSLTQSGAITSNSLSVTGGVGAIVLDQSGNSVNTLGTLSTTKGDVTFVNGGSFATGPVSAGDTVAPGVPNDGNIFLKSVTGNIAVNGNLTALRDQITIDAGSGTITFGPGVAILADVLVYYFSPSAPAPVLPATRPAIVSANGDLTIVNPLPNNSVLQSGYATTGNITIQSATGFDVSGLLRTTGVGKYVRLTADSGSIRFLGNGGAASDGAGGTVAIQVTAGSFTGDSTSVIRGSAATITVANSLSMPGRIDSASLSIAADVGAISVSGPNALGSVNVKNAGNVTIQDSTGDLVIAGITGKAVTLTAVGAVSQTGAIVATDLVVNGAGGAIDLSTQSNTVTSFGSSNPSGSVLFNDTAGSLTLASITGGTVTIGAKGPVDQSGAVTAGAFTVNGNGSAINLSTQNNNVTSFAASNGAGAVSFADSAGLLSLGTITSGLLSISAAGAVTVDRSRVVATGNATIKTSSGGLDVIGQPNGLLQSTGTLNLQGVKGPIALINGGQISGKPILGNGQVIRVGNNVTTAVQLNQAVATVNALSPVSGSVYEIVVAGSMQLTQTLRINRPVLLKGTSTAIVLSGSPAVTNGLILGSDAVGSASGSQISSLAFSGFGGTGIQLNAVPRVAINGVIVTGTGQGTGAGLSITGNSAGTTVRGSTFASNPFGIQLISATGATIGGTAAGQQNRVTAAARAGVFASGFCTGTSVIKTVFSQTLTPYNVRTARNIRIVN